MERGKFGWRSRALSIVVALALVFALLPLTAGPVVAVSPAILEVNGPPAQLTIDAGHYMGSFSPDGSKIVFTGAGGIWVMNADGSDPSLVYGAGTRPKWGPPIEGYPDGLIALAGTGITIIQPDGTLVGTIVTDHVYPGDGQIKTGTHSLDWSPDGSKIAFADNAGTMGIWTINLDGTGLTQITDYSQTAYSPAWSPDDTEIACSWGLSTDMYVGVFNAAGTGLDRTVGIGGRYGGDYPDWGANGIVYSAGDAKELHLVNADGTGDTVVFAGPAVMVAWSPDGKRIVYIDGFANRNVWTRSCPHGTIQDAINAASPSYTISVMAGEYEGNVLINVEGLTLQSTERHEAKINGTFTIRGADVVLEGFDIQGGVHIWNHDNVTVAYNKITADGINGISYTHGASSGGTVTHNVVSAPGKMGISLDHDGGTFTVTHNTVEARKAISFQDSYGICEYNEISSPSSDCDIEVFYADLVTVNYNNLLGEVWNVDREGYPGTQGDTLDATYNWWGDANPSDQIRVVLLGEVDLIGDVDCSPWLPGTWQTYYDPVTGEEIDSDEDGFSDLEEYWLGTDPTDDEDYPGAVVQEVATAFVPEGGTADTSTTNASVTATAAAGTLALVNLVEYGDNPVPEKSVFGTLGSYVDVHTETPENLDEVTIRVNYDEGALTVPESTQRMYYWNSEVSDWRQCSDQGVNTTANFIWAKIRSDTTPDLSYLAGGPFGGGTASVTLNKDWYKVNDVVTVTVEDQTKAGNGPIGVYASSEAHGAMGPVSLTETDAGVFVGTFTLVGTTPGVGELLVGHSNTVTVGYPNLEGVTNTAVVDNVVPTITSMSPIDGAKVDTATPAILATLGDALSGINAASIVMKLDDVDPPVVAITDYTYNGVLSFTPDEGLTYETLTDGDWYVTVDVKDLAGNAAATASWSFTVDTIAPVITIVSPDEDSYVDMATPTISVTFTEGGVGIDPESVVITVDEVDVTAEVTVEGASYTPADNLAEGSHSVTVDVADLAGNAATQASWSFTTDTIAPVIAIDELEESTYLPALTVTGTYTEVNLATITVNGEEASIIDGTWTVDIDLSIGTNVITATATDLAGNMATDSAAIEYEPLAVDTVTVTLSDDEILANGVSTTEVAVLVQDERLIPIAGKTVTLETTAGIIYPTSGVTNSEGKVTATLTSEATVGEATVTATCEGVSETAKVSFIAEECGMPDLVVGWNLISLPLIPVNPGIADVLADLDITDKVDVVWSYDAGTWSFYQPASGVGDLKQMVDGKGYWVRMLEPAKELTVSGFQMPPPGERPPQYEVTAGWNLIGFKSINSIPCLSYLGFQQYVGIQVSSIYGYDGGYRPLYLDFWAPWDSDCFDPGFGYWVYVTQAGYYAPVEI